MATKKRRSSSSDSASPPRRSESTTRKDKVRRRSPQRRDSSPKRRETTPPPRRNRSFNNSHNTSLNTSQTTPSKYVGGDRGGLEAFLAERKRRKTEAKESNGKEEEREKRRKMKRSKKEEPEVEVKEEAPEPNALASAAKKEVDPLKPNFEKSGKLIEETNTYKGIVIKYSEPTEARIPKTKWRLYPFKGDDSLPTMYIHRNSGYLIGRERKIVDIPADHPSCSSQHAVIQFRLVDHTRENGTETRKVKPYMMDLESTNGTFLNNEKIDPRKYYELKEKDVLKFGFSTREYVLLHERSEGVVDNDT